MGGGVWRKKDFEDYSRSMGRAVRADGHIDTSRMRGAGDMYKAVRLDRKLDPYKVMRECCDSEEHPDTVPVILALDVTGSMGGALLKTASSLGVIMKDILAGYRDVEFMVMGIGDLDYDRAPIQISQFESDIRIAEHLDRIWFERGGGGNSCESYSAAWYMGLQHTALDCWKRGKKGIIITLGDEPLNDRLPARKLAAVTGDALQGDILTKDLYRDASEKFDIFHIAIDDPDDCYRRYSERIRATFGEILGRRSLVSTLDALPAVILDCIEEVRGKETTQEAQTIGWDTDGGEDPASEGSMTLETISW